MTLRTAASHSLHHVNVLALDAVLVAVVWQEWVTRSFSDAPPTHLQRLTLGLAVWLVYTLDHWIDGYHLSDVSDHGRPKYKDGSEGPVNERHQFHNLHRRSVLFAWGLLGIIEAVLILTQFDHNLLIGCGLGLLGVTGYFLVVHHGDHYADGQKPIWVGTLFGYGVHLVLLAEWADQGNWPDQQSQRFPVSPVVQSLFWTARLFIFNCQSVADLDRPLPSTRFTPSSRRWVTVWLDIGLIAILSMVPMQGGLPLSMAAALIVGYLLLLLTLWYRNSQRCNLDLTVWASLYDFAVIIPVLIGLVWMIA